MRQQFSDDWHLCIWVYTAALIPRTFKLCINWLCTRRHISRDNTSHCSFENEAYNKQVYFSRYMKNFLKNNKLMTKKVVNKSNNYNNQRFVFNTEKKKKIHSRFLRYRKKSEITLFFFFRKTKLSSRFLRDKSP